MTPRNLQLSISAAIVVACSMTTALAAPPPGGPKCYAADLPGDAALAVAIRPSQILARSPSRGASVLALLHEFDELDGGPGALMRPARLLLDYVGGDWSDVAEIDYALHSVKVPAPVPAAEPDEAPRRPGRPVFEGELIVLQMNEPIDPARIRPILRNVSEIADLGKRYWGRGADGEQRAIFFPDERTVVVGSETLVRRFVQAKKVDGALAKPLAALNEKDDVTILLDLEKSGRMITDVVRQAQLLADAKSAVFTAKFLNTISARLTIEAKREDDAVGYKGLFETLIGQLKEELKRAQLMAERSMPEDEAGRQQAKLAKSFFALANRGLESLRLDSKGATFTAEWLPEAGLKIDEDYTRSIVRDGVAFDPKATMEKWKARQYRPSDPLEAQMLRLLPAATGMSNANMRALGESATVPKPGMFSDSNLTMILFLERQFYSEIEKRFPGRADELKFDQSPRPHLLAAVAAKSAWYGYCTLLPLDSIRKITCAEKEGTVTGKAAFESPSMYRGVVEFTAKQEKSGWEMVELRLPARGIRLHRSQGDIWQLTTALGKGGVPENLRAVTGTVTLDGKPFATRRLELLFRPTTDLFPVQTDEAGKFETELPPGKYVVPLRLPLPGGGDEREEEEPKMVILEAEVAAEGKVHLELRGTTK